MSSSPWSEERVKELAKLWGDGMSAGQIALRFGMTRNQVIAKVHRLQLPKRITNQRFVGGPRKRVRPPQPPKQERPRQVRRLLPIFTCDPLPPSCETDMARIDNLVDLEPHHCKWPIDSVGGFKFCGADRVTGLPYCVDHCRRAFQPPQRMRVFPKPAIVKAPEKELA